VKSPNPAFANVDVPLASTFVLAMKAGKEAHVEPLIENGTYRFTVKTGEPKQESIRNGTKSSAGAHFVCLMSGTPIDASYIRKEAQAGRMGSRLMAIVAEGDRGRVYLSPTATAEAIARRAQPDWKPEIEFFPQALGFRVGNYGMRTWSDLFTPRQTVALSTFTDLVVAASLRARADAVAVGLVDDDRSLETGGTGASAYGDAVAVYLAFAVDKSAVYWNSLCPWLNQPKNEIVGNSFARQTVQMLWDYAEANPFSDSGGNIEKQIDYVRKVIVTSPIGVGSARQADAATQEISRDCVVSCDPPYYDNIGYADLSDFFYVWLRRALKSVNPELFATLAVPKAEELVATPARHGGKDKAEEFFLQGMSQAMHRLAEGAHPAFPITIYYAFKQSEDDGEEGAGAASTGWETFLDAVIHAGFSTTGTWPIRTERPGRMRDHASNALASSIVLVCRRRPESAATATRREFLAALKAELPVALAHLQRGNIAPVDLAQAAIGPGMAVFTRFNKVVDAEGHALSVRQALALINETLDEVLAEQEGDFDVDSRWALAWFDQYGFDDGPYGVAETLSKAKNTSVDGMVEAGILVSRAGKVRLLAPSELPAAWDPDDDRRIDIWEMLHHLIRVFEHAGEAAAAQLLAKYGPRADVVRELAYRLYTACERKKRAREASSYNALVQSWPEIARLSKEQPAAATPRQGARFFDEE
jgi:putative DNA methylase